MKIYYLILNGILSLALTGYSPDTAFGVNVSKNAIYDPKKGIVEPVPSIWKAAWTDKQIVDAIKHAEGKNSKGLYTYGIKSIKCYEEEKCRQICLNTVKNTRQRYARRAESERTMDFIHFLQRRYCPIKADNDPTGLNQNWLKNVTWYLNHPKKGT